MVRMEKSQRGLPIGIFDSGLGGLTVARQIHRVLPDEDLVYLGDTARVPYGSKSPSTVIRFACEDTQFLVEREVKAVVVACNTVSAWALPALERLFAIPIFGVILPGVMMALERSRTRRIGVIGTSATIRSGAYRAGLLAHCPEAEVISTPCPLLVPLVEEGWTGHPVTLKVLEEYLAVFRDDRVDTLILGCTHYPLLKRSILAVLGARIGLVDSAESCARFVRDRLGRADLLANRRRRRGLIRPYVTDETERFGELYRRFLGWPAEPASKVDLKPFDPGRIFAQTQKKE